MGEGCTVWHEGDGEVCVFCGEEEFRFQHGWFALFLGCGVQVGVELADVLCLARVLIFDDDLEFLPVGEFLRVPAAGGEGVGDVGF